jgi:hypothetical protein
MQSTKLIYLLWSPKGLTRAETTDILLREVAPQLLEVGAVQLTLDIADPESKMRSPNPQLTLERPICAAASIWVEDVATEGDLERCFTARGFRTAGYLVDETLYTDYGENRHAAARDWPDGQRSPGVVTVNLLERPRRLTREEWLRRWHGVMSPVSESIQPRCRYVRNAVVRPLSPDAPPYDAIVEEAWELPRNMATLLKAVRSFLDIRRIRSVPMGEYFIRTEPQIQPVRRSAYDM